jgi:hypothetical protein
MEFKYYVAFNFTDSFTGELKSGCMTYSSVNALETEDEIRKLVAQTNELDGVSDAVLMFWKRLD